LADFVIKRGDNRPFLQMFLERDGTAVNLTGAVSARILMRVGNTTTASSLLFGDRVAGEVVLGWTTQTATVADFVCEVEVTWSTGVIETFPNSGTFSVSVVADLG
jgi:hypothetical protein